MPPVVVYPIPPAPAPPNRLINPFITTDDEGNSVAVWFDTSGSMYGATLASGAVNNQGQPAWMLTSPIATANVQNPWNPYAQAVGMDSHGTATAVWADETNVIYASTLTPGQTSWSTPLIINNNPPNIQIANVYIGVAANGNAIVTWQNLSPDSSYSIFANVFDAGSQSWGGQVSLLSSNNIENPSAINNIAIDPNGNAVIVLNTASVNVQAISYTVNSHTFKLIPSLITAAGIVSGYGTIDPAGNATIVWVEGNLIVYAATLPFEQTSFTNKTTLSTSAELNITPLVKADTAGNAVAIWTDLSSGNLASARFSFTTQSWTMLPMIDLGGNIIMTLYLSGDALGNVVASWSSYQNTAKSSQIFIEAANLTAGSSSWTLPTQLSSSSQVQNNSKVILTTKGNAIAIWDVFTGRENLSGRDNFSTIDSSNFLNMYPPDPPLDPPALTFTGKVIKHMFITQTDRVHQLNWGPNTDPTVVQYLLYRNSILIATVPAGGNSFSYQDHNRSKKISDTYMLVSVHANGEISPPLFVTLK